MFLHQAIDINTHEKLLNPDKRYNTYAKSVTQVQITQS